MGSPFENSHTGTQPSRPPGNRLRTRGINYDTGFLDGAHSTRRILTPQVTRSETKVIAEHLRCTAARVSGDNLDRLSLAGRAVLDAGLELWFSPFPTDLDRGALLEFLEEPLNTTRAQTTHAARQHFAGKLSGASGPWESVERAPRDFVSVDVHRDRHNAPTYRRQPSAYGTQGPSERTRS